jgi:hypothetical protein
MRRGWIGAALSAALLGACSTTLQPGEIAPQTHGSEWLSNAQPGEAYIRFSAIVGTATGADPRSFCEDSTSPIRRYFSRDNASSVFVGVNGEATWVVASVAVSDDLDLCQRVFRPGDAFTPWIVLPADGGGVPISINVTNENAGRVEVRQLVSDFLAVASVISAGPTSGLAMATGLGSALIASQKDIDVRTRAIGQDGRAITVGLDSSVRARELKWVVPLIVVESGPGAPAQTPTYANLTITAEVRRSVFQGESIGGTAARGEPQLNFQRVGASNLQRVEVFDPRGLGLDGRPRTMTVGERTFEIGNKVFLGDYFARIYGRREFDSTLANMNYQIAPRRSSAARSDQVVDEALASFCERANAVFTGNDALALTRTDRLVLLWTYLSQSSAWTAANGDAFPSLAPSPGTCFDGASYVRLQRLGLSVPSFVHQTLIAAQPPQPAN